MRKATIAGLFILAAVPGAVHAQSVAEDAWGLTEVAVVKDLPGPALWKVVKDDKIVWIIGNSALKRNAVWDHSRIERIVAGAETLYLPPAVTGGVSDVYRLMKAKDLPGKQTLREVLSPEEYRPFRETADRYGIKTKDMENDRPMWAGWRLREAIDEKRGYVSGQTRRDLTGYAKKNKVKVQSVAVYKVGFVLEEAIKASDEESRECLASTLRKIDYKASTMEAQTAAWTSGDVPQLAKIVRGQPKSQCLSGAVSEFEARSTADTVKIIENAMTGTKRSVLLLPMEMLVSDDLSAELRRRGFTVTDPK